MTLIESNRGSLLRNGTRYPIREEHLITGSEEINDPSDTYDSAPVMREGEFVPVTSERVDVGAVLAFGYGSDNRNEGRNSFIHCELLDDEGNPITGELWARVRDTRNRRTKEDAVIGELDDLAEAASDSRTEKPMFPVLEPAAAEQQYVQFGVVADSSGDGATLDPSASDVKLYMTDIDVTR